MENTKTDKTTGGGGAEISELDQIADAFEAKYG